MRRVKITIMFNTDAPESLLDDLAVDMGIQTDSLSDGSLSSSYDASDITYKVEEV